MGVPSISNDGIFREINHPAIGVSYGIIHIKEIVHEIDHFYGIDINGGFLKTRGTPIKHLF